MTKTEAIALCVAIFASALIGIWFGLCIGPLVCTESQNGYKHTLYKDRIKVVCKSSGETS